ncbi:MAG: hypothetical protein HY321_18050 [Armatimonadetes bacterium]|nr:hypothetical protein [Armatimonadota bacterium]
MADWPGLDVAYREFIKGSGIRPGMWRPHAAWEQVAWVKPPWSEEGHVWLDFPEVIIGGDGSFLYAGHGPVGHPAVTHGALPKVPWREVAGGIAFERTLPSGIAFGGSVTGRDECRIDLRLHIRNGSGETLRGVKAQTCAYLRMIDEFAQRTNSNKYVHVAGGGWMPFPEALKIPEPRGKIRLGWRGGPPLADLPWVITLSSKAEQLVAMTWHADTFSLIGNPSHPCMHADPAFPDLAPGARHAIQGSLCFFEGSIADFDTYLQQSG